MYTHSFYITENCWNNALSFENRKDPKLFVPSLIKIANFDDIAFTQEVTFEDYDFDDMLQTCHGLENLYEIDWKGKKLYLVDNHNHVFYFWYLARSQWIIHDESLLYHIDEHADTRDPWTYLLQPQSWDMQKVFEYTNFFLNVWNYIIPAQKEWLIAETVQIRSEQALEEYNTWGFTSLESWRNIILNLDLDFFSPWLEYIDYELKKQVILNIADKADIITVCTSPFFINQERAIEVFRDIFDNNENNL